MRAIRQHLRDVLAIAFLVITAAGVAGYILANQRFSLPDWVPVVGSDVYELEAEFQTAQAVVPGQGQTVTVAGVRVGDIASVRLEEGRAVVTMRLDEEWRDRVFRDASLLLRPKTGFKDMYLQLDPGSPQAGRLPEHSRIRVSNTLPDVNADEILAALDADARDYLRILLAAGGEALGDERAARDLRATLRRFEPTARDVRRITEELAERRRNIRRVVRDYRLLAEELAASDDELARLVSSANATFAALAEREQSLRSALAELPPTLETTRDSLRDIRELAGELGPALAQLRPAARNLAPALREVRPFLRQTEPVIARQLRPFARGARAETRLIRRAAEDLGPSTTRLLRTTRVVNSLLNTLAYNPPGQEEGFLFWLGWANHAGASLFSTQDAHGPIRRGVVLASCTALAVLEEIGRQNPNLEVLIQLLNAPRRADVCPQFGPQPAAAAKREGER